MLKTLKRVASYARPYLRFFVMTIIFAAAGVSLSLAVPIFIGEAVDCCIGKGNVDFDELKNRNNARRNRCRKRFVPVADELMYK